MSITLRRDPVCSCPITDHRGLRLDANELWLHFFLKKNVAAINIILGVPGQRADKTQEYRGYTGCILSKQDQRRSMVISITQSSQIELADWLGIIGTTRRRGTIFPQN